MESHAFKVRSKSSLIYFNQEKHRLCLDCLIIQCISTVSDTDAYCWPLPDPDGRTVISMDCTISLALRVNVCRHASGLV